MIDVIFGQLAQNMRHATEMVVSRQNTLDRIGADFLRTEMQIQANQQNAADDRFFREYLSDKKAAQDFTAQEFLQARRLEHDEQRNELLMIDQWLRQKDRQNFEMRLAEFNAEQQSKLEHYRQECAAQRQEKQMSLDVFMFEKKKQLEKELKAYDRETQRLGMLWSLRNLMVNADYQRMRDAHPLVMDMKITLNLYAQPSPDHAPVPPLVIYVPPALEFERAASNIPQEKHLIQQQWAFLENRLTQSLNDMFENHYAQESCRPVRFFGNAYKTKALRGKAAICTLFDTHGMIPTIVIETEADGNQLNMYAAWWETGYVEAKRRKFLTVALPDAAAPNLAFAEAVGACQSILAGLLTDSYYLRHYQTLPELPRILPELLRPVTDERQKQQVIKMAVAHYQKLYESLAPELAAWIPDLAAEFAHSLSDANYAALAKEQLEYALRAWLSVKGQSIEDAAPLQQLIARIEEVFTPSDISFIETANACLAKLGERQISTEHLKRTRNMEREQALERELAELKRKHQEEEENRALGKYRELRDLLAAGKWYDADELTKALMLKEVERTKQERLNLASLKQFPAHLAQTIDRLWVKYSNGRFGFSVQKRIFEECRQQVGAFLFHLAWTQLEQYHPQDVDDVGHLRYGIPTSDDVGHLLYGIPTSTVRKLTYCCPQNSYSTETLPSVAFNINPFMRYSLSAPEGHLPAAILINPMLYETYQEQQEYQKYKNKNFHAIRNDNTAFFKAYLEELWAKLDAPTT